MISTLLKLIQVSNKLEKFGEHEELNEAIKETEQEVEILKNSFEDKSKIKTLLLKFDDFKHLQEMEKADNVLMLGVKIGIEIGKTYKYYDEF